MPVVDSTECLRRSCEWTFDEYLETCVDQFAHWAASVIQGPAAPSPVDELAVIADPEIMREARREARRSGARRQERR